MCRVNSHKDNYRHIIIIINQPFIIVMVKVISKQYKRRGYWSARELYRPNDRRGRRRYCQLAMSVPTAVNLSFLDRTRYFFFQVAPQLSLRGWVDPVPDPLFLWISGAAENRIRGLWICSQELWPLDRRGGLHNSDSDNKSAVVYLRSHLKTRVHFWSQHE
jgi:hypothetical protein